MSEQKEQTNTKKSKEEILAQRKYIKDNFQKRYGDKKEVFTGIAYETKGHLKKDDIVKNKRGKYVSKRQSEAGKKRWEENKEHMQLFTKKPQAPQPRPPAKAKKSSKRR